METGILAEWYVSEGSSFSAGEPLAKVETDKGETNRLVTLFPANRHAIIMLSSDDDSSGNYFAKLYLWFNRILMHRHHCYNLGSQSIHGKPLGSVSIYDRKIF